MRATTASAGRLDVGTKNKPWNDTKTNVNLIPIVWFHLMKNDSIEAKCDTFLKGVRRFRWSWFVKFLFSLTFSFNSFSSSATFDWFRIIVWKVFISFLISLISVLMISFWTINRFTMPDSWSLSSLQWHWHTPFPLSGDVCCPNVIHWMSRIDRNPIVEFRYEGIFTEYTFKALILIQLDSSGHHCSYMK